MKRSSCLPALLLGLTLASVFASRTASAAPEGGPAGVRVAQLGNAGDVAQQPADPPPEGQNPPAPPQGTTAPTVGDGSGESQPALSIGTPTSTTTPPADQTQASAEEPKKKPKPRAWSGTQLFLQNSVSTATFIPSQQQDYNPTVDSTLFILPRYAINKDFQLRGRLLLSYEYTNSDSTKTRNEPVLSDTSLQMFYRAIPAFKEIKPMVSLNVALPSSKLSRSRTMLFSPGATLQLVRAFPHVLGGEIDIISGLTYTHPVYRYTTAETLDPGPYSFSCFGGNACQDQLSGLFNPSDILSYSLIVSGEWGKWSPAVFFLGSSQWTYTGRDDLSFQGRPIVSAERAGLQAPSAVRQTSFFMAWVDHHTSSWLTTEVGYFMSRSILSEAGTYANPFFDRYNDMRLYLGFNVNLDSLMQTLEGEGGEGGVVRAKNTKKQPMFAF
jgi:hypothetical protein